MLLRGDIYQVLDFADYHHDVFVVKHDYTPKNSTKFLGNAQHAYPKKNWSSFMLFNCWASACKRLTPEIVNEASGKYLHQFDWTNRVGELPGRFNHLVGEYGKNDDALVAHFTLGTPCFNGFENQDFADEWREELLRVNHADN